ncbi:MAG: hypothetical protein IKJ80_02335 [Clostridia bacterium]|nr:hypothetical protein [Clostridia bacterium]
MKTRFLALLLAAVSVLCLVGCTPSVDIPDAEKETCIYSAQWLGRLIRYDLTNKKATVVCPDPACEHKDCTATDVDKYCVGDDHIVYVRKKGAASTVYCYYISKGELVKIMDCEYTQVPIIGGSFAYFAAANIEYDEAGKPLGRKWHIYKYNMETNELRALTQAPVPVNQGPRPEKITETNIFWQDETGGYTTDLEYQNRQPSDYHSGMIRDYEQHFEVVWGENAIYTFNITAENLVTGEIHDMVKGAYWYRLDFFDDPKGVIFTEYKNGDPITELKYVSFDTFETRKLCDAPEGYCISQMVSASWEHRYVGDYVGIYVKRLGSTSEHGEEMMIVNVTTGENFIISP